MGKSSDIKLEYTITNYKRKIEEFIADDEKYYGIKIDENKLKKVKFVPEKIRHGSKIQYVSKEVVIEDDDKDLREKKDNSKEEINYDYYLEQNKKKDDWTYNL